MRPRLTPSTGISTLRASSAARRKVPSPPRTRTSSQPSAARSSASTTSISTPSARMSSGARCSGPRSTASADSTRSANPVVAEHFLDPAGGLGGLVAAGVHDQQDGAFARHCGPSATARRTACVERVTRQRDGRCRRAGAGSTRRCPTGPGSGLAVTPTVCQSSSAARRGDREHRVGAQLRVGHDPAGADLILADLELRLHHGNDIGVGRRARSQRGQHRGQRDERQVGDDEVDRPTDRLGGQVADVGALHDRHPRIGPQRPGELAVADVDGDDLAGAAVQQHLGEPAGRGAGVQAAPAVDRDAERVERADQLVRAARHPGLLVGVLDGQRGGHRDGRRGLGRRHAVDADPAGADQLGGLLPRARQPAPHQLGVNTSAPRHARLSPSRPIPARAPGGRAPPRAARRRRRCRRSARSGVRVDVGQLGQQRRDLGADLRQDRYSYRCSR